jgi:hypothetical protein
MKLTTVWKPQLKSKHGGKMFYQGGGLPYAQNKKVNMCFMDSAYKRQIKSRDPDEENQFHLDSREAL